MTILKYWNLIFGRQRNSESVNHQRCYIIIVGYTWSDSKVMRLIFSWLYWQYRSPLTQTAVHLDPSPIPTCSDLALQWLIVEKVPDVSRRVWEPCRGSGSTEHCTVISNLFFVLNSVTMLPQHMEHFSRPLEMMQCQEHKPFAGTKCFLKAEPLLKMSSAADDNQQHRQGMYFEGDHILVDK